jgi:hypothetical protein
LNVDDYQNTPQSIYIVNKRLKKPKGQPRMDNPENLSTKGTQDKDTQNKTHSTMCAVHHYMQANTNNVKQDMIPTTSN